jgi:hypothetical protein
MSYGVNNLYDYDKELTYLMDLLKKERLKPTHFIEVFKNGYGKVKYSFCMRIKNFKNIPNSIAVWKIKKK